MFKTVLAASVLAAAIHAQSTTVNCGPLTVTASPSPAPLGANINVTVTNTSLSRVSFPSCHVRGFVTSAGQSVTCWSCGMIITHLQPGESSTTAWDQTDCNGAPVPPGSYSAVVVSMGGTCTVPFTIAPCPAGSLVRLGRSCGQGTWLGFTWSSPPALMPATCPQLGTDFRLSAAGMDMPNSGAAPPAVLLLGQSNTSWAGSSLPLSLGNGCSLYTSIDAFVQATPLVPGVAEYSLQLPPNQALRGLTLYAQVAQPLVSGAGFLMTDALAITLY